jgi:hypothetical protein
MRILFAAFIFFLFMDKAVGAEGSSCLPAWTSLQSIEVFDTARDYDFTRTLYSENASGRFATKVLLDGHYSAQTHQLTMRTHFDDKFGGVSLPYNLFSALVIESGEVNGWQDFTKGCNGPGVGFYPGQTFQLPVFKLKASGTDFVQIMIWGSIN